MEFPGLKPLEAQQGSGDLTVQGDFIAKEEFVGAGTIGGAHRQDGAEGSYLAGGRAGGHIIVEGDFLHSKDSILAPAGSGQDFYQHRFHASARLVFRKQVFQHFEELAFVFAYQDDGVREHTVTGAVAGRVVFALRSDGAF